MALTEAEIKTAIDEVLANGQSFVTDGIQYTAANLGTLHKMLLDSQENAGRVAKTRPMMRRSDLSGMGYS